MFGVPPPNIGAGCCVEMEMMVVEMMFCDAMWSRRTELGSSSIFCVIVPAAMKDVRSCGIRGVPLLAAIWLGKGTLPAGLPMKNGVMSTGGIVGFPLMVVEVPWATPVG